MNPIRSFIAISLPPELQAKLAQQVEILSASFPSGSVRWVRPEGRHLTLKFLGGIRQDQLDSIQDVLSHESSNYSCFTIQVGGLGCFPNPRRPRVLWVGVEEPSGTLQALVGAFENGLSQLGFESARRSFTPHVTLGRVKSHIGDQAMQTLADSLQTAQRDVLGEHFVTEISLMRSMLKPSGAVYSRLGSFPLRSQE